MPYIIRKRVVDHRGPEDHKLHKAPEKTANDEIIDTNDTPYEPFEPQNPGDI
jgi:hypothetical protein